jgi:hypothetical protein
MVRVEVNKKDLNHLFACLDKLGEVVKTQYRDIPQQSAREFATLLKRNIRSQKYMGGYLALGDWKKGERNASKFWMWHEEAVGKINFQQISDDSQTNMWFAGFGDPGEAGTRALAGRGATKTKTSSAPKERKSKKYKSTAVKRVDGKLVPVSAPVRQTVKTTSSKQSRRSEHGEVKHIDPKNYVLQTREKASVSSIPFNKLERFEKIRKRVEILQHN